MNSVSFLPFPHRSQVNKKGFCPLKIKIRLRNDEVRLTTGIFIAVELKAWDKVAKRLAGRKAADQDINHDITEILHRLQSIEKNLRRTGEQPTPGKILEVYNSRDPQVRVSQKIPTLLECIKEHNEYFETKLGQPNFSESRFGVYKRLLRQHSEFLTYERKLSDIRLADLNKRYWDDWTRFLRKCGSVMGGKPLSNDSANKYLKAFKHIIHWAIEYDYLEKSPSKHAECTTKAAQGLTLCLNKCKSLNSMFLNLNG